MKYQALKQEIEDRLTQLGVTWEIQLIGDSCPPFCEDKGKPGIGQFPRKTHIHGQHYRLTLTRPIQVCRTVASIIPGAYSDVKPQTSSLSVDYWNSYANAELLKLGPPAYRRGEQTFMLLNKADKERTKVRVADVLGCAQLTSPGSFESFCGDLGYDTDSRKAESVWRLCCDQYNDFRRMFTEVELDEIGEKAREL